MIRIALDTSTVRGSVALEVGDRVYEAGLGAQSRHAESLVPALDGLVRRAGIARDEIGEVVVGAGPGSFTGVRVAGATAKALAAALDVPLVAYSSLLALAAAVTEAGAAGAAGRPVCALFDARRGEAYGGCWRVGPDSVVTVLEPTVGVVTEIVAATLAAGPVYAGDGAVAYRDRLAAAGAEVAKSPGYPEARTLLGLARRHPDLGRVADVRAWQPAYVRGSSARP